LLNLHPDVHISKKLQPDLLNLVGSRTHIAKSLMNLISNTAEAMPSSGTISVTTENRYLDTSISGFETVSFETYKRIVARKPGQKAIIVSGYSESEQVGKTQELGEASI
jgi:signal transduction histidine kinase